MKSCPSAAASASERRATPLLAPARCHYCGKSLPTGALALDNFGARDPQDADSDKLPPPPPFYYCTEHTLVKTVVSTAKPPTLYGNFSIFPKEENFGCTIAFDPNVVLEILPTATLVARSPPILIGRGRYLEFLVEHRRTVPYILESIERDQGLKATLIEHSRDAVVLEVDDSEARAKPGSSGTLDIRIGIYMVARITMAWTNGLESDSKLVLEKTEEEVATSKPRSRKGSRKSQITIEENEGESVEKKVTAWKLPAIDARLSWLLTPSFPNKGGVTDADKCVAELRGSGIIPGMGESGPYLALGKWERCPITSRNAWVLGNADAAVFTRTEGQTLYIAMPMGRPIGVPASGKTETLSYLNTYLCVAHTTPGFSEPSVLSTQVKVLLNRKLPGITSRAPYEKPNWSEAKDLICVDFAYLDSKGHTLWKSSRVVEKEIETETVADKKKPGFVLMRLDMGPYISRLCLTSPTSPLPKLIAHISGSVLLPNIEGTHHYLLVRTGPRVPSKNKKDDVPEEAPPSPPVISPSHRSTTRLLDIKNELMGLEDTQEKVEYKETDLPDCLCSSAAPPESTESQSVVLVVSERNENNDLEEMEEIKDEDEEKENESEEMIVDQVLDSPNLPRSSHTKLGSYLPLHSCRNQDGSTDEDSEEEFYEEEETGQDIGTVKSIMVSTPLNLHTPSPFSGRSLSVPEHNIPVTDRMSLILDRCRNSCSSNTPERQEAETFVAYVNNCAASFGVGGCNVLDIVMKNGRVAADSWFLKTRPDIDRKHPAHRTKRSSREKK